jgi:hypothetical protein
MKPACRHIADRRQSQLVILAETGSATAAVIVFGIGLLVLGGWILDLSLLTSFCRQFVPMRPSTSLALMLLGGSLWYSQRSRKRRPLAGAIARTSAALVTLLGLLTLSEDVFGLRLSLAGPLPNALATLGASHPGRMATNTAASLVFLGLALLLLDVKSRDRYRPAEMLAALGGMIGLVALMGYLYGASPLYALTLTTTPISVPAAVAVLFGALGVLAARPDRGLVAVFVDDHAGGAIARRFLLPIVLLPLVLDLVVRVGERAGFYHEHISTALHSVSLVVAAIVLLWFMASYLNHLDAEREGKAAEILRLNDDLERRVEERTTQLQATNRELANEITERKRAEAELKTLNGLIPICAACKKVRDDQGYWKQVETYVAEHSAARFSHGLCPSCVGELYPGLFKEAQSG